MAGEYQQAAQFLVNPESGGLTAPQLNQIGLQALQAGAFLAARGLFQDALNALPSQADSDEANFFLALSRFPAIFLETQTTGGSNATAPFATLGGVLGWRRFRHPAPCQPGNRAAEARDLSATSPQADDVRIFLRGKLAADASKPLTPTPDLSNAIAGLNKVLSSFTVTWTPPFQQGTPRTVTSDQGDALALSAIFQIKQANFRVISMWNYGGSISQANSPLTTQAIIAGNATFLNVADPSLLGEALAEYAAAGTTAQQAATIIQKRTASQSNFLITLTGNDVTNLQTQVTKLNAALSGKVTVGPNGDQSDTQSACFLFDFGHRLASVLAGFQRRSTDGIVAEFSVLTGSGPALSPGRVLIPITTSMPTVSQTSCPTTRFHPTATSLLALPPQPLPVRRSRCSDRGGSERQHLPDSYSGHGSDPTDGRKVGL